MLKGIKHTKEAKKKIGERTKRLWKEKDMTERTKKVSESHKGSKSYLWKGGQTKEERSWQKNKRNRVLKRINEQGLTHTWEEWETLKIQYGYTCPCCKKQEPGIKLTEDHIIPLSKGGTDLIENIQPLCRSCNCKKYTKSFKY